MPRVRGAIGWKCPSGTGFQTIAGSCTGAHSLALAALRFRGYRATNRYIVFQALEHTLAFPAAKWRFLDDCHSKRNLALYEGDYFEDPQRIAELITVTKDLLSALKALGPIA